MGDSAVPARHGRAGRGFAAGRSGVGSPLPDRPPAVPTGAGDPARMAPASGSSPRPAGVCRICGGDHPRQQPGGATRAGRTIVSSSPGVGFRRLELGEVGRRTETTLSVRPYGVPVFSALAADLVVEGAR